MNRMNFRSLLAVLCTVISCAGASAEEVAPFPEIVHVEKGESSVADLQEALSDQISYNPDDAFLHRIHNDSYYHIIAFSDAGDVVKLHDDSQWSVHPTQCYVTPRWVQSDTIFIKPQSSCFSTYRYVLHNYTTQQAVEANLIYPGVSTFRITNIEPYSRLVILHDNTVWQVDATDPNFPYWQIGQRIMVGLNNHWRTSTMPNILINVDLYGDPASIANFYGYPVGN